MDAEVLRQRTKRAVANWCGQPQKSILMSSRLSDLLTNAREELRQRVNQEFEDENSFPVTGKTWEKQSFTDVASLRDFISARLES